MLEKCDFESFYVRVCRSVCWCKRVRMWRERDRERRMSTHDARRANVWWKKKNAVTNMFVSMRQRETALSRLPLWVVYKKICHIFLNPHHQPPCSTQPLVTPDWSCNVFPLSKSQWVTCSFSLHMLLWDLGRLQTQEEETVDKMEEKEAVRRECLNMGGGKGGRVMES